MKTMTVTVPWGEAELPLQLPENWNLAGVMKPSPLPKVPDPLQEAQRSLQEPIGSGKLSALADKDQKIVIVIDDDSRPTPVDQVFPAVIEELQRAGVSLEQLTIVPALGVHRPMTDDEIFKRVGQGWQGKIKCTNPDSDDPEKQTYLGTTSRGTPVKVNNTVAGADLVISIGCIEPHVIASFGGGYKNLIPGVASRETIAHNHALNCQPGTFNNVGRPIENNPMRLDLEEAGRMFQAPVFIVNAVLNSSLEVVRVVSGDPVQAHRQGVEVSRKIYGVEIPSQAEVVITNSHPMDQDLRQGVKALANTIRALKPGGVMLTLIKADEGVGVFGLANRKLPVGRGILKLLAPLLMPRVPSLKLKGMGEEDRFFLYFALQAMLHGTLLVYGPTIPPEIHERLPFVQFTPGITEGLEQAHQKCPGKANVLVFPNGGSTYPILPGV